MSSAASSPIMLLRILKCVKDKVLCKAFAILIIPTVLKLLLARYNSCSLVLLDKTIAISSAASSPTLLLLISNVVKVETSCKAFVILIIPTVLRLLSLKYKRSSLVL